MSSNRSYPPNFGSLSPDVIGSVVMRPTRSTSYLFDNDTLTTTNYSLRETIRIHYGHQPRPQQYSMNASSAETSGNDNGQTSSAMTTAERTLMLQRQSRARAQQRYRNKIKSKLTALVNSVAHLKDEIDDLSKRRAFAIPTYGYCKTTSWAMVVEYERIFRYGYKPPKAVMKPAGTTTYDKHKSFLQTAMMPGFLHNKGQGGDDLLQIWQSISEYNETLETRLVRLEYGAEGVMIAYMDSDSTITLKRLEKCLLSISGGEDYKCLSLASKLLGQRLVVPMSVRFEWDEMNNRISSMHYEPDFLTPLLKILGNLEETTRVLNSTMAYPNL